MKIAKPYHEGELEVQERVGVRALGERNGVVIQDAIITGALPFIEQQNMAILGSIDEDKNIWASVLSGPKGFMTAESEQHIVFDLRKSGEEKMLRSRGRQDKNVAEVKILRKRRVLGCNPNILAAPCLPSITQRACSSTRRMWSRSIS